MYIKNKKGPKIDLCVTPARISTQDKHLPFKRTLCFLLLTNSSKIIIISPQIPFWRSLKIYSLYHTLPKALEISTNIPRTLSLISKALKTSWLIERSWLMHKSLKCHLPFRRHVLKIILRGWHNQSPKCFNIRMLIMSLPWAYLILGSWLFGEFPF